MKYSKVEIKEVKCCSDCKRQIAICDHCNNKFEVNDEIICEVRHHFHQRCNNKATVDNNDFMASANPVIIDSSHDKELRKIDKRIFDELNKKPSSKPCLECKGTGTIKWGTNDIGVECSKCKGQGFIKS